MQDLRPRSPGLAVQPRHAGMRTVGRAVDLLRLALAVPAVLLYAVAAGRYLVLWRRRPSLMLLTVMARTPLSGSKSKSM